jgi:hypothetical protein
MWRKVVRLQNVKSCQISIGRSVVIDTVRKEEEAASVESAHFQSIIPRKEGLITALMSGGALQFLALDDRSSPAAAHCLAGVLILLLCIEHCTV